MRAWILCGIIMAAVTLGSARPAQAADYGLLAGVGTNFSFETVRVRYGAWEFGLLTRRVVGLAKRFDDGSTYVSFGPGLSLVGEVGVGFFGAVGVDYELFSWLHLRGELMATAAHNAHATGNGMVGLSLEW